MIFHGIRFVYAIVSFLVILILYILALAFGWFETIEWFDVLMHFLGGGWIGYVFFLLLGPLFAENYHIREWAKLLIIALSFVSFAGVLWEFFEFGVTELFGVYLQGSLPDTMGDLFVDLIGGLVVSLFILFISYRKNREAME